VSTINQNKDWVGLNKGAGHEAHMVHMANTNKDRVMCSNTRQT